MRRDCLQGFAGGLESLEARRLLAADPISPDNPLWSVLPGSPVVDGILNDPVWASAQSIFRTEPFRTNSAATMKMVYDTGGLYISFDVKDAQIWADGRGNGIGLPAYEVENDDSMTLYFDPDNSRDQYLQTSDFGFGINLGNPESPPVGQGAVRLVKYIKGDGNGGAPGIGNGMGAPGMTWRTVINGTPNNNADIDVGWTTEIFLPWATIGLAAGGPVNSQSFGMNFDIIFDQEGGLRDFNDNRNGTDRWNLPPFVDDHIEGVPSSYNASLSGIRGPVNYAEVMFMDPRAGSNPGAIAGLSASRVTGYSATLAFNAPAGVGTGASGHVSGYQIRYSPAPITTEGAWLTAAKFAQAYVPRLRGLPESLRFIGLSPNTAYHVVVRAIDAAGNLGPLSNDLAFTTKTVAQDVSGGQRVVPSPMGRTLVLENGQAYVPVGDHIGAPWNFARSLYPGLVWDEVGQQFLNFSTQTPSEGPADPYFDELVSKGVNILRLYLEVPTAYTAPVQSLPDGTLWLEWREPGQQPRYNDHMRVFMRNVLREASERNMHVIFSPIDTFYTAKAIQTGEWSWHVNRGGPVTSISNFFILNGQVNTQTLDLAKARMQVLTDWVKAPDFAPYVHALIGWETASEWDGYGELLNPIGNPKNPAPNMADTNGGREDEMRLRVLWNDELGRFIKQADPDRLTLQSTISQDPRGPIARDAFYSRVWDVNAPHLYTVSNTEPINNPAPRVEVRPAIENGNLTVYWMSNTDDRRPTLNGEWGHGRDNWPNQLPQYSGAFTEAEDEAIFRTVLWSGLAAGQPGTGLKMPTDERIPFGVILSPTMRDIERSISNFVNGAGVRLDYTNFSFDTLSGRLSATSAAGRSLLSWGISDGAQGVIYVLRTDQTITGTVADGVLTIEGLRPDQIIDAEIWDTGPNVSGPLTTISGVFTGDGRLVLNLPAFSTDVAIKFRARPGVGLNQRVVSVGTPTELVTFYLDNGEQPVARITDAATGVSTTQDISTLSRFSGRLLDMTPFTANGQVWLAATDTNHHLWVFVGSIATASWVAVDLTALINAPGMTSDLTTYQPSWNAIHIAGLDARGHSINYWIAPGQATWNYNDLTAQFNGPVMAGGLTGFVAPWDGLNIAGLDAAGNVIVYWWAPGLTGWQTLNMTVLVNGPLFTGQLDAYVQPWGAMNITGRTQAGEIFTFWWLPGRSWVADNITAAAPGGTQIALGTEVAIASNGGINIFGTDSGGSLRAFQWYPNFGNPQQALWQSRDVSAQAGGPAIDFPLGSSASGNRVVVLGRSAGPSRTLLMYTYQLSSTLWTVEDTLIPIEI